MMSTTDLDRLGGLVSTIGSRDFGGSFYALFRDILDIEECTVFAFAEPARPQSLIVEGECEEARTIAQRLANDYVAGGYRMDPIMRDHGKQQAADIYVLDAGDIDDASYREHYYNAPALTQELVVMGDAGGTLYYSSFYRRHKAEFGQNEVAAMRSMAGFIIKTLHRHSQLVSPAGSEGFTFVPAPSDGPGELRERTLEHLRDVLLGSQYKLSQREAEVCAGIVMGYSTLAISLNCSISTNTVATHRKRAYAKMGISSQNELFVRYFSTVRDFQAKYTH